MRGASNWCLMAFSSVFFYGFSIMVFLRDFDGFNNPRDPNTKTKTVGTFGVFLEGSVKITFSEGSWIPRV